MKARASRPARAFDIADFLDSPAAVAAFLDEAIESGDARLLLAALRDALRSRVFSDVASAAGVSRESLHRTLAEGRDARLSTIANVLRVVGCRLAIAPAAPRAKRARSRRGR